MTATGTGVVGRRQMGGTKAEKQDGSKRPLRGALLRHGREGEQQQHEDRNSQVQDPGPAGPLPRRRGRRPAVRVLLVVLPYFLMLARPPPARPAAMMARARVRAGKLA